MRLSASLFLSPSVFQHSSMSFSARNLDDFLIREIVLTHDPDENRRLDSEQLLGSIEATFSWTTENPIDFDQDANFFDVDLSRAINKVSTEMLLRCNKGENLHRNTLEILEILGCYRWDDKMVVALASFMQSYGLFWLILRLQSENELAFLLATVRRIPSTITLLKPKFEALNMVVRTILRLMRLVISYESSSVKHELVDDQDREVTRSKIYLASYWICRSIVVCSSQIADLRNLSFECSDRTVIAAWGLYSLGNKLSSLCCDLQECIDKCQQQIEARLYEKLLHMFTEKEADNQKALRALFVWDDELPFENSSREKIGILEMKSKTVMFLFTKPDLLPLEMTYFLVQQTSNPSQNCVVLWLPIPPTSEWTSDDKTSFEFFSSRVPWLSVRKPWSLNSAVITFIREEWGFIDDPILVVLNEDGLVANRNAMDMVWIWGPKAFPFTLSRERELWKEAKWTVGLLIDGISPLLSEWVEQGKNLCIYGSNSIEWVRKFNEKMKKIRASGIEVEVVYVGCKNGGENVRSIIHIIDQEDLSSSINLSSVDFFWFRLETLKRSIGKQDETSGCNEIAARVGEVMELGSKDGWFMIGSRFSIVELEMLERGLGDDLEARVDGERCRHDEVVEYEEELIEKAKICGLCKSSMQKFVVYKCEA